MPAVDFVLLPKSRYRLNKHPSLTFPIFQWESVAKTVMIALEKSIWKVMQMYYLVEFSSHWHMIVAQTLNSCKFNVFNVWHFETGEFYFSLHGCFVTPVLSFLGNSGKVKKRKSVDVTYIRFSINKIDLLFVQPVINELLLSHNTFVFFTVL